MKSYVNSLIKKFSRPIKSESSFPLPVNKLEIYMLPTAEGVVCTFIFILIALLCLSYRNNQAFVFLSFIISYFIVSLLFGGIIWKKMIIDSIKCDPLEYQSQDYLTIKLDFSKLKYRPLFYGYINEKKIFESELIDDNNGVIKIPIKAAISPGVYSLPVINLSTKWPIMTTISWIRFIPNARFVVLPFASGKKDQSNNNNNNNSNLFFKKGNHGEPLSIRPALSGEIMQMSWKHTLKKGRPMIIDRVVDASGVKIIKWPKLELSVLDALAMIRPDISSAANGNFLFSLELPDGSLTDYGKGYNHEIKVISDAMLMFCDVKNIDDVHKELIFER